MFERSWDQYIYWYFTVFNNRIQLHQHQAKVMTGFEVKIEHLHEIKIIYNHTSIYSNDLQKQFFEMIELCNRHKIIISNRRFGVLTHNAFHGSKDLPNYYAGIELMDGIFKKFPDQYFIIPEGK